MIIMRIVTPMLKKEV